MPVLESSGPVPARRLRAVLFDLDNTLVDFMRLKRVGADAAARAMLNAGADFPFGPDEAGDILFGEYLEDIEGNDVFERFVRTNHQQKIGLSSHAVDRITAAAVNAYLRAKLLHTEPYRGVRRTLVELVRQGVRLGVVTDAPRFKAYQRLEAANLLEFFDFVVSLSDHGERKPAERPFRTALELLGMRPAEVLFVGDWPEKDMAGARAVGMATAWARYGRAAHALPVVADHLLDSVEELIRIVPLGAPHA